MSLYFGATCSSRLSGRAIRWVTMEEVNHILGLTYLEYGWVLIEATKGGFIPIQATARPDHAETLHDLFVLDREYEHRVLEMLFTAKVVRTKRGKPSYPYDFVLNVGWLCAGLGNRLWKIFGGNPRKWRPAIDIPDRYNCSEAYAEILDECSVPGSWTSWMNPGEFVRACDASSAIHRVSEDELLEISAVFLGAK